MEVVESAPSDHGIDLTLLRGRIEAGRTVGGTIHTASELRGLLDAAQESGMVATVPTELFLGALLLLVQNGTRNDSILPLSTGIAAMLVDIIERAGSPLIPQQPGSEEQLIA